MSIHHFVRSWSTVELKLNRSKTSFLWPPEQGFCTRFGGAILVFLSFVSLWCRRLSESKYRNSSIYFERINHEKSLSLTASRGCGRRASKSATSRNSSSISKRQPQSKLTAGWWISQLRPQPIVPVNIVCIIITRWPKEETARSRGGKRRRRHAKNVLKLIRNHGAHKIVQLSDQIESIIDNPASALTISDGTNSS